MTDFRSIVELDAPDISPYRQGNTGIDYVHRLSSGKAGPDVLVTAIVHGNEICGAIALDRFLRLGLRPAIGSLTLCFANVAAYREFDPSIPYMARYIDEDFNRLWSPEILDSGRQSVELTRAREIRPVVERADYLLDIHSMSDDCQALILAGMLNKGADLSRNMGAPQVIVQDRGHAAGPRLRDHPRFINPDDTRTALLVECGQHWKTETAETAFTCLLDFLTALGMLSAETNAEFAPRKAPPLQETLRVTDTITVNGHGFTFARSVRGLDVIAEEGTLIGRDGGVPVYSPYDNCVLIMPTPGAMRGHTAVRLARRIC